MELNFDPEFSLLIVNWELGNTFLTLPKPEVVRYMKFCFLHLYQQNGLDFLRIIPALIINVFQN